MLKTGNFDEQRHIMDPENIKFHYGEIPTIFKSFINEKEIENCVACGKYLLNSGTQYFIEKAVKNGEVEVEYAMCIDCIQEMRKSMSEESLERTQDYMSGKIDLEEWNSRIFEDGDPTVDKCLNGCVVTGVPMSELSEYQMYGHFDGKHMVYSVMPYIISFEVLDGMQELLSAKTKEELDRFMDEHFGLPPEWRAILKKDIILL